MGELTTREYLVLGTELAEGLDAAARLVEPSPGGLAEIRRRIRGASPMTAWLRKLALQNFSDTELEAFGCRAVERIDNQAGAEDLRSSAPESPTAERSRRT